MDKKALKWVNLKVRPEVREMVYQFPRSHGQTYGDIVMEALLLLEKTKGGDRRARK